MPYFSVDEDLWVKKVYGSIFGGLKPDPPLNLVEWVKAHRRLPPSGSNESGKYRFDRFPHLIEIHEALSPGSGCEQVVFLKPVQIGGTECANNLCLGYIHMAPGPIYFILPTGKLAEDHSKSKFQPSIDIMPVLKDVIKPPKNRESRNTILRKEFPGGSLIFGGSNSDAGTRNKSIRVLILSDIDGFPMDISGLGDTIEAFKKRTDSYGNRRKIYIESTLGRERGDAAGISRILYEYKESSQGRFCTPCPHCGEFQYFNFLWDHIKDIHDGEKTKYGLQYRLDKHNEVVESFYKCKYCGKYIDEGMKYKLFNDSRYVHKKPHLINKSRGFMCNALHSPGGLVSWNQVVSEYLKSFKAYEKGATKLLKIFVNQRMVQEFKKDRKVIQWRKLKNKAEGYQLRTIPSERIKFVSISVDVHDRRLDILVVGWGRGDEAWVLDWNNFYIDDIRDTDDWYPKLDNYCINFPRKGLPYSVAIDSGDNTQIIYNYARFRYPTVVAVKGAKSPALPTVNAPRSTDINYKGEKIKDGIKYWPVGTTTTKKELFHFFSSLKKKNESGELPRYIHFSKELSDDFFKQLCAEELRIVMNKSGYPEEKFIRTGENHALDAFVYNRFNALRSGILSLNFEEGERKNPGPATIGRRQPKGGIRNRKWLDR